MAGEIKFKESFNQTLTRIFIGKMLDYSIAIVEESITIACMWLDA